MGVARIFPLVMAVVAVGWISGACLPGAAWGQSEAVPVAPPTPTEVPFDATWVPREAMRRDEPSLGYPAGTMGDLPTSSPAVAFGVPPSPTAIVQPAEPTPTPYDERTLPPLAKAVESLRWEASLAENSHKIGKSEATRLALLVAYERVIGPICMPELHRALAYGGSPTDPRCLEYLDKTSRLDINNPLVVCAREGIDAKLCRLTFEAQKVEPYFPGYSGTDSSNAGAAGEQLDAKLGESTIEPKLMEIDNEIKAIEYRLFARQAITPEQRTILRNRYEQALALACRVTRLAFAEEPTAGAGSGVPGRDESGPSAPTPPPLFPQLTQGDKPKGPMAELLEKLGDSPTVENPIAPEKIRKRLISDRCRDFIDRALRYEPVMALPVCYREGFYTPACIDARRAEKRAPRPTVPPPGASAVPGQNPPTGSGGGTQRGVPEFSTF